MIIDGALESSQAAPRSGHVNSYLEITIFTSSIAQLQTTTPPHLSQHENESQARMTRGMTACLGGMEMCDDEWPLGLDASCGVVDVPRLSIAAYQAWPRDVSLDHVARYFRPLLLR